MKKLRRFVVAALASAMMLSLCACGGADSDGTEKSESNAAEGTTAAADIKIGLITLHDENSTYDLNFINAFKSACEDYGLVEGESYFIVSNIDESDACYEAACDLAEEGCDIVFADSFGHESFLMQAAEEYPDVQFCHATGTQALTSDLENFHNAFAAIYEGRYLAGIAAGMKLNEMIADGTITADQAVMGYVGAYPYAEVISGYTSFYLGAKSVCDSVTMKVTFTNSWYDEALEKTAAQNLIDAGCVLISQHADSMGAPTACEDAGVPDVAYNGSTAASGCENTYLASCYVNWAPYFTYILTQVANGAAIEDNYIGTFETGSVCLNELGSCAAEGTQEAIDAAQAELEAGTLHVFDCASFTVNGENLTEYMADVDGDYAPDTNVIIDGYFAESDPQFRSAPYFDIECIDGISEL